MAKQPDEHANLGGDYARDPHRGGYGDDYARDRKAERSTEPSKRQPKDDEIKIGKASE